MKQTDNKTTDTALGNEPPRGGSLNVSCDDSLTEIGRGPDRRMFANSVALDRVRLPWMIGLLISGSLIVAVLKIRVPKHSASTSPRFCLVSREKAVAPRG